jgi:hypothetical protein
VLLNGWKEIANHVQRGVRTVQRWERDLGFPVRRLGNRARAPVLAASEEVDQWLVHWSKGAAGPQDAILLLKIAEARRSALHKKVNELMRRKAELLEATSKLRSRLKGA